MKKIEMLSTPDVKAFVSACRQFYTYMEAMPDKAIVDFWSAQMRLLSNIYNGVFALPPITARYSSDLDKFVTEKAYTKLLRQLTEFIGPLNAFADMQDVNHTGTFKQVEASLAEMLADIYQEMKDFVLLYETETLENMNDAIVECMDSFGQHWGVKLLSTLRIIHINLYEQRYADKQDHELEIDMNDMIDDYEAMGLEAEE